MNEQRDEVSRDLAAAVDRADRDGLLDLARGIGETDPSTFVNAILARTGPPFPHPVGTAPIPEWPQGDSVGS